MIVDEILPLISTRKIVDTKQKKWQIEEKKGKNSFVLEPDTRR